MAVMKSIQAKLLVLKNSYKQNLEGKRQELTALFQQVIQTWDNDQLSDLYRMAHSIKGSSATFGFTHLSQAAATLETALMQIITDDHTPDEDGIEQLTSLHRKLDQRLQNPEREENDSGETFKSADDSPPSPTPVLTTEQLTILLTDDEEFGRQQVAFMLEGVGHQVIQASTGAEAIMLYDQYKPDLIIMDVVMPEMNGYEAARAIKSRSGEDFVPIIFLTGLTEDNELVKCIENGGDDFLIKPVNSAILHARIFAMQRISELNHKLYEYQSRTEEEITLAKHIFERITARDSIKHERLSYLNEPAGHFSGDILVHQAVGDDRYYVMLGDFTGHGLTAAIGAIPAADIFHSMSKKNAPLYAIAEEINKKLSLLLPTSHFLAATLIAVDFRENTLNVLNCGLPSAHLYSPQGEVLHEFKSVNLALGIIASNSYRESVVQNKHITPGCHFMCASDGLVEAHNPNDERYGNARLAEAVKSADPADFLGTIRADVERFTEGMVQQDDITIMTIDF